MATIGEAGRTGKFIGAEDVGEASLDLLLSKYLPTRYMATAITTTRMTS